MVQDADAVVIPDFVELREVIQKSNFAEQLKETVKIYNEFNEIPHFEQLAREALRNDAAPQEMNESTSKLALAGVKLKLSVDRLLDFGLELLNAEKLTESNMLELSDSLINCGVAQYNGTDFNGCISTLSSLIPLHEGTPSITIDYRYIAKASSAKGDFDTALKYYELVIQDEFFFKSKNYELTRHQAFSLWEKAELLYFLKRKEEAKVAFETIFETVMNSGFRNSKIEQAYMSYRKKFGSAYEDLTMYPMKPFFNAMQEALEPAYKFCESSEEVAFEKQFTAQVLFNNSQYLDKIDLSGGE